MADAWNCCKCFLRDREVRMRRKTSTYGLRLDQIESLFSVSAGDPDPAGEKGDNEKMADLLRKQLTCPLAARSVLFDVLVMMMERQGYDTQPLAGRPLGEVLQNPQSDVGLLRAIKDCSKRLSCTLDSQAETALATTIYFAALAGALVYHDKKITQYSYEKLDESFALLIEKKWMAKELVELFSEARRTCQGRQGKE